MEISFIFKLILIPCISAAIGWVTNKIAVWLLFNPKEPKKFLGMTFQGVFPKRQDAIAERIGDLVADNLLSTEAIKNQIFTDDNLNQINHFILDKVDYYLEVEFPQEHKFLDLFVSSSSKQKLKDKLEDKIFESMEEISENFHDYLENKVNIRKLVSDKIKGLDSNEVNDLMNKILKSELGFIELSGAFLGFIIGLIQVSLLEIF